MAQNLPQRKRQWTAGQLGNPWTNCLITSHTVIPSSFVNDLHELCREPALPKSAQFSREFMFTKGPSLEFAQPTMFVTVGGNDQNQVISTETQVIFITLLKISQCSGSFTPFLSALEKLLTLLGRIKANRIIRLNQAEFEDIQRNLRTWVRIRRSLCSHSLHSEKCAQICRMAFLKSSKSSVFTVENIFQIFYKKFHLSYVFSARVFLLSLCRLLVNMLLEDLTNDAF